VRERLLRTTRYQAVKQLASPFLGGCQNFLKQGASMSFDLNNGIPRRDFIKQAGRAAAFGLIDEGLYGASGSIAKIGLDLRRGELGAVRLEVRRRC